MTIPNLVRGAPGVKHPAGSFGSGFFAQRPVGVGAEVVGAGDGDGLAVVPIQSRYPGEGGYGCDEGVPYRAVSAAGPGTGAVGGCCLLPELIKPVGISLGAPACF